MRIFLTGGRGFLGSNLSRELQELGHQVTIASRLGSQEVGAPLVRFDLTDVDDARKHLEGHDICVHLACSTVPSTAQENPERDFHENVIPTIRLAALCENLHLKRFIFCSSGGTVYGRSAVPSKESDPLRPISTYGAQKAAIEAALHSVYANSRTKLKILRVANPYGLHQKTNLPQGLVGHLIRAAQQGSPFTMFGDGTQVRDYIAVEDVASAFAAVVGYQGTHDTFNVGTGVGTSTNEVVENIKALLPCELTVRHSPSRPFDLDYNVLDVSLLSSETGWRPRTNLVTGLCAYVDHNFGDDCAPTKCG